MMKSATTGAAVFSLVFQLAVLPMPGRAQNIETVVGGGFVPPVVSNYTTLDFSVGQVMAVAVDSSETLYVADATHGSVYRIAGNAISVVAGNGTPGNTPVLQNPTGLALDGNGQLFIADEDGGFVYKVILSSGAVQLVAGCGSSNSPVCPIQANYGDQGKATAAFLQPASVAVDSSGNLFIADSINCRIRKVDANGTISTVAGSLTPDLTACPSGPLDSTSNGDGGPAVKAQLFRPQGVIVDSFGDLFIADTGNSRIREVCGSGSGCGTPGNIKTVAGGGSTPITSSTSGVDATTVAMMAPTGLALNGQNLYVSDFQQNITVVVNTGATPVSIGYFAPSINQNSSLRLNGPAGLAYDSASQSLYIADSMNFVVESSGGGGTGAFAGNGLADSFTGGNSPLAAQLAYPLAVVEDASSNIYISESSDQSFNPYAPNPVARLLEEIPAGQALKQIATPYLGPLQLFLDSASNLYFADNALNQLSPLYGVVPIAFPAFLQSSIYNYEQSRDIIGDPAGHLYFTGPGRLPFIFKYIADYQNASFVVQPSNLLFYGGYPYSRDALGDGDLAENAKFLNITGLCTDSQGNIYATDDSEFVVRAINMGPNPLTVANKTIAAHFIDTIGGGKDNLPQFLGHYDLSADDIGDGGPATSALLSPQSCFVDNNGNVLIADGDNDRVRRIDFVTGNISTVAGTQYPGFSGDKGPAVNAALNFPNAVWGDQAGNLFISDSGNHRIREVEGILPVPNSSLSCQNCALTNATGSDQAAVVVVSNTGKAPLVMTAKPSLTDATDFSISGSTCPLAPLALAANTSCQVSVVATGGKAASTQVILHDNAALSNAKIIPDPDHPGQWAGYLQYSDSIHVQYYSAEGNFDPLSLVFTAVKVRQSIHVTNTGSVPFIISKIDVPPPFSLDASPPSDSCTTTSPFSVATNAFCNIYLTFMLPATSQANNDLFVSIKDNTDAGTTTIPVTGYALVPSGSTTLSISNQSATPATAKFSMVGIPQAALVTPLCSVTPAGLDVSCSYDIPSQTITATASIPSCTQTTEANLSVRHNRVRFVSAGAAGVLLLLPWVRGRRKRPLMLIALAVVSSWLVGLSACSSASHVSSSCVASVAPGTKFMLFVTATPQTPGQFPSLTLTSPDVISVTQ